MAVTLAGKMDAAAEAGSPPQMGAPVLEVCGLQIAYPTAGGLRPVVRNVSFMIPAGSAYGLIGESGSGKSSIALAVMHYLPSTAVMSAGTIRFAGLDLGSMSGAARRALYGNRIAMVYQEPMSALNPCLKVGFQVAEAIRVHQPVSRDKAMAKVRRLFEQMHLPEPERVIHCYPHQLSGGQQQRVVIAMALACDPDLLVLDEPTTGLDVTTEAGIIDLIDEIRHTSRTAILFITHNLGILSRIADRIGVIYAGELVEEGPARRILDAPAHPYTRRLLAAVPQLDAPSRLLRAIPGRLPGPGEIPTGCVFAPRCSLVADACRTGPVSPEPVGATGWVRCLRWRDAENTEESVPGSPGPREGVAMQEPLLTVTKLSHSYRLPQLFGRWGGGSVARAVEDVSFQIFPREVLALVGESGSGKSTIARILAGLLRPERGEIRFRGARMEHAALRRRTEIRRQIQMVFQNVQASLNPRKTVAGIVGRPLYLYAVGGDEDARIDDLLTSVRLDRADRGKLPGQLSGGEKQRVSIASALAPEPALLICDEPVSALDVSVRASILNLLQEVRAARHLALLFISHDLSVVRTIADRVLVLYRGRVVEEARVTELFAPPYHPYTEGLIAAIPRLPGSRGRSPGLLSIKPPLAGEPETGKGCPFQARCPRSVGAQCREETPPFIAVSSTHRIACHLPPAELMRLQGGPV